MDKPVFHPRFARPLLNEALQDTPAVLIHGPRQCGKTTLARSVGDAAGYSYISFDVDVLRASIEADPVGFVADLPDKVVLDEVQRVPKLFTVLKVAIDRDRRPGRFILTGSANVLLLPRLADSLAGRLEILRLHPLAQSELAARQSNFLDALFGDGFKAKHQGRLGRDLADRITAGGYSAALARPSPSAVLFGIVIILKQWCSMMFEIWLVSARCKCYLVCLQWRPDKLRGCSMWRICHRLFN